MADRHQSGTLLAAVTANGASSAVEVSSCRNFLFAITATGITNGATMAIEARLIREGTYVEIDNRSIASNGTTLVQATQVHFYDVRANVIARQDGTFSVNYNAST
jgi:hypothetical protein